MAVRDTPVIEGSSAKRPLLTRLWDEGLSERRANYAYPGIPAHPIEDHQPDARVP